MQKELIKQRFSKSLKTYQTEAIVQKKMAKELVKLIDKVQYKDILELGCGTGFLTSELFKTIDITSYDAMDIVSECKKYIENISKKINFICTDIDNFSTEKKYDLIISNASLQWVDNLPEFFNNIKNNLKLNGYFVFTLFGKNNFHEMKNYIKSPLKYYSVEELKNILNDFEIEKIYETEEVLEFDNSIDVLHHIKNTGVNALSVTQWKKSDLINFQNTYPKNKNNKYNLTYCPIYVKLSNNIY